ncbi:MAG TPA: hypothetical protein VGL09_04255 [Methylomirabilota bacterium]
MAYVFFGHPIIDFDGSPTAYGPPGIKPTPLDDLGNAWSGAKGWFGVAALSDTDPLVTSGIAKIDKKPELLHKGKYPVIQQAKNGDPNPDFYVSATPHPTGPVYRQSSYVDASQVSFGALSGGVEALGFKLGDCGLAIRHDDALQSGFYFGDVAPDGHVVGECSHHVGTNLGGTGRARTFDNNFPVSFIIFPRSSGGTAAPRSDDAIKATLTPFVRRLSQADNADELPLLMGFNEVGPPTRPQGMRKLETYRAARWTPRPMNYDTIVRGLKTFGWSPVYTPTYTMSIRP